MGCGGGGRRSNENQSCVTTPNEHESNMAANSRHNFEFLAGITPNEPGNG